MRILGNKASLLTAIFANKPQTYLIKATGFLLWLFLFDVDLKQNVALIFYRLIPQQIPFAHLAGIQFCPILALRCEC